LNPVVATTYAPEFRDAFREICRVYKDLGFVHPEIQVLVLMLDNDIRPCRATAFNLDIVRRLGKGIF